MRILLCLVCLAAFFGWGSAAAVAGAAVIYPLPEVKLFQLQERTVAAVAIEHSCREKIWKMFSAFSCRRCSK